jgi:hypothetical protein
MKIAGRAIWDLQIEKATKGHVFVLKKGRTVNKLFL